MQCAQCDREGKQIDGEWTHKDGRVSHPFTAKEENVARTRVVSPTGDEEYVPVLQEDDPADASLMSQAEEVFGEMASEPEMEHFEPITPGITDEEKPEVPPPSTFGTPKLEDMVTVRGGGKYLTARRRIVWLRGEPEAHPDWTIDTYAEEIERGKYVNNTKVTDGYARYRANVFDASGRLVGTGTKTEWSERFMDFAEKAETGAIARALAVCGYGTEAALDMDEGLDQDRVADAPVATGGRAISITASNVPGLVQGGRSTNITGAQLNEIARLMKVSGKGEAIVPFIENVLNTNVPELGEDPNAVLMAFFKALSFDEAATLIQALNKALSSDKKD